MVYLLPALASVFLAVNLPYLELLRRKIGFTSFRLHDKMGLGSAYSPRMLFVRAIQPQTWIVPCMPFWLELISFFSSSLLSMFISSSLTLTIPISLALFRMKLPDSCLTYQQIHDVYMSKLQCIVIRASHAIVTNSARRTRLL